jgi:DNA-binding phage protein
VALLITGGMKRSDAVRQVAAASGLDRRELYRPD